MIQTNSAVLKLLFKVESRIESAPIAFKGVVSDTRKPCKGALFIALNGDNFDGHNYVDEAFKKGAVIALVSRYVDSKITQILVEDTLKAYGLLANYWRKHINPLVIGITGSNGKTTVKEMLASILKLDYTVLATAGNLNNEIGVPQTVCELSEGDEVAIIEMGANHKDEIRRLSDIAEPNIVYVNNASATHLEGFGSLEGVQKAKGELYRYAKKDAQVLINADDPAAEQWVKSSNSKKITTLSAQNNAADIRAQFEKNALSITQNGHSFSIQLKVKGEHNHSNALAAASLALAANSSEASIKKALGVFTGFKGRLQFIQGVKGATLIDDSYNANPTSFKAGINVLCELEGEAWLAMGDMAELGKDAQQDHDNVVDFAKHKGVKAIFAKGVMSKRAARLMLEKASTYDSFEVMSEAIKQRLDQNVNLLIKGSRSAKMDVLVRLLSQEPC